MPRSSIVGVLRMRRFAVRVGCALALATETGVAMPTLAAADTAPPVVADASSAAFTYTGAWNGAPFGVYLAPGGTASVRIRNTPTLQVKVWATGQTFSVSIDGGPATSYTASACKCFETMGIASGLTSFPHAVVLTNQNVAAPFPIRSWIAAGGGLFAQYFWSYPGPGDIAKGKQYTFFVQNTSAVSLRYTAAGASFRVNLDDRWAGYSFTTPSGGTTRRLTVAWGLTPGLEKITLTVTNGTLSLQAIEALQAAGKGKALVVAPSDAKVNPLLAVYGDSLAAGQRTLGPDNRTDGYSNRLVSILRMRLLNRGVGAAGAKCFGVAHVNSVIGSNPDVVVVHYGLVDMVGQPYTDCDPPTIEEFETAMGQMLDAFQAGLPDARIVVLAILPTARPGVTETTRADWNAVLQRVSSARSIPYVDPSPSLDITTDYADPLHPNNLGHEIVAEALADALA